MARMGLKGPSAPNVLDQLSNPSGMLFFGLKVLYSYVVAVSASGHEFFRLKKVAGMHSIKKRITPTDFLGRITPLYKIRAKLTKMFTQGFGNHFTNNGWIKGFYPGIQPSRWYIVVFINKKTQKVSEAACEKCFLSVQSSQTEKLQTKI